MIISKEVRKLLEHQVELYEERIVAEKFMEAGWALSKLTRVTASLNAIKDELKGE